MHFLKIAVSSVVLKYVAAIVAEGHGNFAGDPLWARGYEHIEPTDHTVTVTVTTFPDSCFVGPSATVSLGTFVPLVPGPLATANTIFIPAASPGSSPTALVLKESKPAVSFPVFETIKTSAPVELTPATSNATTSISVGQTPTSAISVGTTLFKGNNTTVASSSLSSKLSSTASSVSSTGTTKNPPVPTTTEGAANNVSHGIAFAVLMAVLGSFTSML